MSSLAPVTSSADLVAPREPGFGAALLLIVVQLVFRLAVPDEGWANFLSILLQAACGSTSRRPRLAFRLPRSHTSKPARLQRLNDDRF